MDATSLKPLSKRALSGGSQVGSSPSARPPNKKAKESVLEHRTCSICSEALQEKTGTAHKACTASTASVVVDGGKTKILVQRDPKSKRLMCPRCVMTFYATTELKRHAKMHMSTGGDPSPSTALQSSAVHPADAPPDTSSSLPIETSRARPPPPDTIATPLLQTYGLVVNTFHKILICLACQGVIEPSNIRKHFLKYHPHRKTPLNLQHLFDAEATTIYPNLTSSPAHPTSPIPPVYGLEDPVLDYQMCTVCSH